MKKTLLLLLAAASLLIGGTTGKISGTVLDQATREALLGATVQVVGTPLGAATGPDGSFIILNVPPGTYSVRVSSLGYEAKLIAQVRIAADQTTMLNVVLNPGNVELSEVIVDAEKPAIQKDVTSSMSVISSGDIENLPVASFTDLIGLQAGVVGNGSELHIRGGRSNEVAYMVDGAYVDDPLLGGLATQINNDAIQEMSMLSGTFNAEYGNAMSGVVNIVTRDGGERLAGKVEMRTSEFGVDAFSRFHEMRYSATLSGPLLSDLSFFVTAENDRRGSYLPFGYNNSRTVFTKLSYAGIPTLKMTLSNRGSLGERKRYSHAFKYIPELYTRSRSDSYQSLLSITHTVADNLFYDVRISYFNQGTFSGYDTDTSRYIAENDEQVITTVENGLPHYDFYSYATTNSLTDSRTANIGVKADAVWQIGKNNEVKFGAEYKTHRLRLLDITGIKRPIQLQYIDNYFTDSPFEISAYAQDKLEFPYLVINLGLRFDYMNANVGFRQDPLDPASVVQVQSRKQLSPRIGIAHPISDRTKLHFAYGHFFQNPDYRYMFENKEFKLSVREPVFGQPSLDAQRTVAYEVGVTHQFTEAIIMSTTAYYKDISGLIGTHYYPAYEVPGRYSAYTLYINEDYANVKGFEVNLDLRLDQRLSGGLTYTYSVAKGNASTEEENVGVPVKSTQLTYLDFDKTHVFNASMTYSIPSDDPTFLSNVDLTLLVQASSGFPYTPGGRDVGYVVSNSLRMPSTYSVDAEIGKDIELQEGLSLRLFAEIMNLTNQRNVVDVYSDTGDPEVTFVGNLSKEYQRDPSNYGPPRNVRIGASIKF
ncbi:MAG: TonB-dependent receptor [Bacteroidetes bacterium]|nr:TonB-dependent receptor [Bacteroidota bacterium]